MKEEVYIEPATPRSPPSLFRRVSWGAIFAGLLVTIVLQFMLTLLGVAIGAATINPLQEQNPTQGLALGSAIWLLASGLISLFSGACVAGRLAGGPRPADGLLHGIVTWSAVTLTTMLLLATTTGMLIGGTGALLSQAIGGAAQSSQDGGSQTSMASMENQIKNAFPEAGALLPPTGRTAGSQPPGTLTDLARKDPQLAAALARMESHGGAAKSSADSEQVVQLLTSQHGINQQEASQLVTQWDQQFQQTRTQAERKVRQTGDVAARNVSKGATWAFIALLLGALVAAWGGWAGTASLRRPSEITGTSAAA